MRPESRTGNLDTGRGNPLWLPQGRHRGLPLLGYIFVLGVFVGGCGWTDFGPVAGQSHQSSCREVRELAALAANAAADVELQIEGRTLTILHRAALTNCCLTTEMQVKINEKHIDVREQEQPGVPCRCLCPRDLSVMIYQLRSELYSVRLYRDDQPEPFWEGEVQIQ